MKRELYFRTITYDSNQLFPGLTSYSFFQDHPESSNESVTRDPEKSMVRWLFSNKFTRDLILGELTDCDEETIWRLEVEEPIIPDRSKKPGDIDILIYKKDRPDRAIAVECKRVKVRVQRGGSQKVNKVQDIREGIRQVNALQSLGFHQSYLIFLIAVDARMKEDRNIFFKYDPNEGTRAVYEVPMDVSLHRDVGVAYIEIVQPTGKTIYKMGIVGICVDKRAAPLEQSLSLTERIKNYLIRTGGH